MVKVKKDWLFVFASFALLGCQGSLSDKPVEVPIIHVDQAETNIRYSDIVENTDYVVLNGLPQGVGIFHLARIFKFDQGYICFEDRYHLILLFDDQGKYISHIDARGGGPGEYVQIEDMTFDEEKGLIYILDRGRFLLKMDLGGKALDKIKLPKQAANLVVNHQGEVIFSSLAHNEAGEPYQCVLWRLNADGSAHCLPQRVKEIITPAFNSVSPITRSSRGDAVYFGPGFTNKIYKIWKDRVELDREIVFGSRLEVKVLDKDHLYPPKLNFDEFNNKNPDRKKAFAYSGEIHKTEDYLILALMSTKGPGEYLLCTKDQKVYSSLHMENDVLPSFFSWRIRGTHGNKVIHHMYYENVEKIRDGKIALKDRSGKKLTDILTELSDVLVIMTLADPEE